MVKTNTNISIDFEILMAAKGKIRNLSKFIEDMLREYLEMPDNQQKNTLLGLYKDLQEKQIQIADIKNKINGTEKENKKKGTISIRV